ncbi:MAG TPA: class I adenylate-forming enzyme family protein [Acidimicrobiia bacterium]|nr:class I adenylate-forming enzyme family protein [Acidimicrobiia bacterium]
MVEIPDLGYTPTIPAVLHRAVQKWGDVDFVVTPDRRMTFAEAEGRSRRLAKRMIAAGIGKGTRVGLYFTYGQEWVIAWLAASRIGALVMPLATTYRPAEIRKVLRIGDIDTLLTARTVLGRDMQAVLEDSVPGLADAPGPRLFLPSTPSLRSVWVTGSTDRAWATAVDLEAEPDVDPRIDDALLAAMEAEVVPADLAQVTYTSGSSADPKGVVHTHAVVLRATYWFGEMAGGEGSKIFCAFPFFWIGGTLVLGAALQSGLTVVCIERFEPGAALDVIETEQAAYAAGWPTLLQAMRDHPTFPDRALPEIAGLTSGPSDVAMVAVPVPGIPGHRGMSETVGNFRGVEIRCIDPDTGEERAALEEGELRLRGHGLMHGYYKKEREEVFDEEGWFHTGDRVFLFEGRPFFVGRYTEMVKSQGANVAPREVELFLETFDEVLYAFVVGMPHPEREEEVTAVLVPAKGFTIDVADLQRRAREQISPYKVPTRVEIWEEDDVPWLGSGKPDKLAIKARLAGARETARG